MKIIKTGKIFPLRPEILSVVCGLFWMAVILVLSVATWVNLPNKPGPFYAFFEAVYPGYALHPGGVLLGLWWAFLHGYLAGFLVAYIYKWLLARKLQNLGDTLLTINLKEQPFVLQEGTGANPYTIVFVANPFLRIEGNDGSSEYQLDPIMTNKAVFTQVVLRCIRSFSQNELLGQPALFNRMRLLMYFDPEVEQQIQRKQVVTVSPEKALCVGLRRSTSILGPRQDTQAIYDYVKSGNVGYCDIVYLISANEEFTRSAARFTEENPLPAGVDYRFTYSGNADRFTRHRHAYCATIPGAVALSAWDDRLKTPVHEFAHAMSSVQHGAIDDEYIDETFASLEYRVNKLYRGGLMITRHVLQMLEAPPQGEPTVPEGVRNKLLPLVDKAFPDEETFSAGLRSQLGTDEFNMWRLIILKYSRFRPAFVLTENSFQQLANHIRSSSDRPRVLNALKPLLNQRHHSRGAFYAKIRNVLQDEALFVRYRSLIARFANFYNVPVPPVFARYQLEKGEIRSYAADRNRSDKEMSWVSYTPGRVAPGVSCIMDIAYDSYRFDNLLFDWMYDRLYVKINRPDQACSPGPAGKAAQDAADKAPEMLQMQEQKPEKKL